MKYFDELKRAMTWLGQKPDTLFLGQAVSYPGTGMTNTLSDIEKSKLLEMPVNEDMQMGMTLGMALNGTVPISIYPRWNFLLLAANQVVNHLDKMQDMSKGDMKPKVIIRVAIGSKVPFSAGPQHTQNHTEAVRQMLTEVEVVELTEPDQIFEAFKTAYEREDGKSTLIIEHSEYYGTK